jgi:uncharacterized protein
MRRQPAGAPNLHVRQAGATRAGERSATRAAMFDRGHHEGDSMSSTSLTDSTPVLAPVAGNERIQALDVVRGFALIGIFLMNIEFFNRPTAEIGIGLPATLQGIDWWAGYLVYVLVQGKFWTMFSLLFGMGFAVMLTRAERAGRGFVVPYLRRIAALAAFGALHHVFLWSGDILFSYAVGAVCLLLVLWVRWWVILLVAAALALLAGATGVADFGEVAGGLTFMMLASIFLNNEARVGDGRMRRAMASAVRFVSAGKLRPGWGAQAAPRAPDPSRFGRPPRLSLVFLVLSTGFLLASFAAGMAPSFPADARWPCLIGSFFMLALGLLSWRFKAPAEARPRRLGATMYLTMFAVMLAFGLLQVFGPARPQPTEAQVAAAMVEVKAERAKEEAAKANPALARAEAAKKKDAATKDAATKDAATKKPALGPVEQAAQDKARQRLNLAEREEEVAEEVRLATSGTYVELVRYRAKELADKAAGEFVFAIMIVGMFLLGYWFVRSGVMERTGEHLPLFRKMALVGIPLGVGAGVLGSLISTHMMPGVERDPYQIAQALMMLGNLPACLGYVGLVVLLLHGRSPLRRIAVLAPLGRMALTNYLTHSLVCSLVFYGYGAGYFGMGRAAQVGFVFAVIALQVVFCTWWLSRYRYGPMEWLWRAITYWQLPAMRREPVGALGAPA